MLQDVEAGTPLELEAIVGLWSNWVTRMVYPYRYTKAVYACVKLVAQHAVRPT